MPNLPPLSEEQTQVFDRICSFIRDPAPEKPYFTVHGLAGSGKTVLLSHVYNTFPSSWACALSGKAADVLRRKTGYEVDTIHSTFYSLEDEFETSEGKSVLEFNELHSEGDLIGKTALVDEVSMIPDDMAQDMIRTGIRIVAFGDPGQLPPVQGAQFFSKPDATLKTIHRQALDSPIIRQAHLVRAGRGYKNDSEAFRVTSGATKEDLLRADAILCWKNKSRQAMNARMRSFKGITADHPVAGEMLMCLRNAKDFGLYNGATYKLLRDFQAGESRMLLEIEGRPIEIDLVKFENLRDGIPSGERAMTSFTFSYAMTVHKAQGSEFDQVLLVDEYSMEENRREWLYTGITRAAKSIQIVRRTNLT